jgi:hypothetical protein
VTQPPKLSAGELTARLVVEFCLPHIQGNVEAKAPVQGRMLDAQERAALGVEGEGVALIFLTSPDSVLMHMAGSQATIWFKESDCNTAAGVLDDALKKAFPKTRQLEELAHPSGRAMRVRAYEIDLGEAKLCRLEAGFPTPGAADDDRTFVVRVNALKRETGATRSPPASAPAAQAPSEEKKKKGWF